MNSDNLSDKTKPTYGNIPYHYLYGRHQQYGTARATPLYGMRPLSHFNTPRSDSTPVVGIDEGPQTVEQLIEQGYFAVPAYDPDTAILHDKKHTSWLALDDVLGQIHHRYEIYRRNMLDLEWAQCYAFTELARGGWPASEEQHALYQRRRQELKAEQRAERVTFWRDVSRLRERLPESAQQYLSAFRKIELLDDIGGDHP
jgi:hypothetical protein